MGNNEVAKQWYETFRLFEDKFVENSFAIDNKKVGGRR